MTAREYQEKLPFTLYDSSMRARGGGGKKSSFASLDVGGCIQAASPPPAREPRTADCSHEQESAGHASEVASVSQENLLFRNAWVHAGKRLQVAAKTVAGLTMTLPRVLSSARNALPASADA